MKASRAVEATKGKTLGQLGEDAVVVRLLRGLPKGHGVICGPSDDCAVIGTEPAKVWTLLKTDCVIEGIHFLPGEVPEKIGWKALARTVSDIAAMGGLPLHALVTLAISPDVEMARAEGIYAGLAKCARKFGIGIVGGETARSPGAMFIAITLTGHVERKRCVFRSGGRAGDRLFVTGKLGGSIAGKHLAIEPRVKEARWLTENFPLRAMMDLSDGLGADLPRMALASKCGFRIDKEALPLSTGCTPDQGISDGEDYELLFAVRPRDAQALQKAWARKFPKLRLTEIGELTAPRKGRAQTEGLRGYDHFA
jgi:thiamine-monophosphate kinase